MRELFGYQKRSVDAMVEIETRQNTVHVCIDDNLSTEFTSSCGFLAEPTGSGKTTIMLAFIKQRFGNISEPPSSTIIERNFNMHIKERTVVKYPSWNLLSHITLVVVSPNLVEQWHREAKHNNVPVTIVQTSKDVIKFMNNVDTMHDTCAVIINERRWRQVCLAMACDAVVFARVVYDESNHLACFHGSKVNCQPHCTFTWYIAAASTDECSMSEMMPDSNTGMRYGFYRLTQSMIKAITVRTPQSQIQYPGSIVHVEHKCTSPSAVSGMLSQYLDPDLRERVLANDVHGALQILGATEESNLFSVVTGRMNRDARGLRFQIDEMEESIRSGLATENAMHAKLTKAKESLAQIERQLSSAESRFDKILTTGTCSICLDNYDQPVMLSCCYSIFCAQCIIKWQVAQRKCPMCRSNAFQVHRISSSGKEFDTSTLDQPPIEFKTKFDATSRILTNAKKTVIYSRFDSLDSFLTDEANAQGLRYIKLRGTSMQRSRAIQDFKNESQRVVMFASAVSDCAGVDLPEITDIILWHSMTHAEQSQIVGRCRRVSTAADSVCTVHHMC